jgi:hypothetical protein
MKKTVLLMVVLALCAAVSQAGVISLQTTRSGGDSVGWAQLGPDSTSVPNPFSATSVGGIGITGSFAGTGSGMTQTEGVSWFGNFTIGDALLWSNIPDQAPITLVFNHAVAGFGAQIQADNYGAFTAQIAAYNGATLLGTFVERGNSTSLEDGSAIYLGVMDTAAEITSVRYSMIAYVGDSGDFAINAGSISPVAAPEPATFLMLGGGLAVAALLRRRRVMR